MPVGRPPKPVWIDGVRFDSTALARIELGVPSTRSREFTLAVEGDGIYGGHRVSRHPPKPRKPRPPKKARKPGALLADPCTHRLGAYGGGRY